MLVADYWFVRRKQLRLADLYRRDGVYAYGTEVGLASETAKGKETGEGPYREGVPPGRERVRYAGSGFNPAAIGATLLGCGLAWIGLVVKPLAFLYDYAWFVGAGGAGLAYVVLMEPERKRLLNASKP